MLFLERTLLDLRLATYGLRGIREAKAGGSGPVSLRHKTDAPIGLVPATTGMEPPFRPRHAFNAPTLTPFTSPGPVSARYRRPQPLQNQGKKAPHPLPRPADGVVILAPFGSDRRDPNTLAPNRNKARPNPLRPSRTSTSS